ncbi:uncharacterized protein LOC143023785 [Oratosquilla oratoria]|uniref:uncharacterized protein LOC143023785 n=1 Tax=Oratosquilla oratoria TaxID=337810 RepID=UPI003F775AE5
MYPPPGVTTNSFASFLLSLLLLPPATFLPYFLSSLLAHPSLSLNQPRGLSGDVAWTESRHWLSHRKNRWSRQDRTGTQSDEAEWHSYTRGVPSSRRTHAPRRRGNRTVETHKNTHDHSDPWYSSYSESYTTETSATGHPPNSIDDLILSSFPSSSPPSNSRSQRSWTSKPKTKNHRLGFTWPSKKISSVKGDIILGGLHMVHERQDDLVCGPIMPQGGVQALEAMLYTIDFINDQEDFIPGVTIGAKILDDCDKDTYGLEQAVDFIKGLSGNQRKKSAAGPGNQTHDPTRKPNSRPGSQTDDLEAELMTRKPNSRPGNRTHDPEAELTTRKPNSRPGSRTHDSETELTTRKPNSRPGSRTHDSETELTTRKPNSRLGNRTHDPEAELTTRKPNSRPGNRTPYHLFMSSKCDIKFKNDTVTPSHNTHLY